MTSFLDHQVAQERPLGSAGFEWSMTALSAWWLAGLYLDGWAHLHVPQLETFFTPWHAVFYSGFLAVASFTLAALIRNHARGYAWMKAVPAGYELSVLGVLIFAAGGLGDMVWHLVFGIEASVEALYSPTHIILALGLTLVLGGPLRAARRSARARGWFDQLPAVLSLAWLLSIFTFFTQIINPLGRPWAASGNRPISALLPLASLDPVLTGVLPSTDVAQILGIAAVLVYAGLLTGVILFAVRHWGWSLPSGALTLTVSLNAVLMGLMRDQQKLIPAAAIAGITADLLLRWLRPAPAQASRVRLFAFAVPTVFYLWYFLDLKLTKGIWWSVHLWAGSIVLAGVVGWLLSYLLVPPD